MTVPSSTLRVPETRRLWISVVFGLAAGMMGYVRAVTNPISRDFGQTWFAARAVFTGGDPYQLIGFGKVFEWNNWFYPLPAAFVAAPFAPFPEHVADALFIGVGVTLLAWTLMEHGAAPMLGLMSKCVALAIYTCQWSPLLASAWVLAPVGVTFVAKPTLGAAMFAAKPSWWAFYGGLALILLAFLVNPSWVSEWRHALGQASVGTGAAFPYLAPVMQPAGLVPLLAIVKWRRPEARLLFVLALVPQTLVLYEAVFLLLIPRTWVEAMILVVGSWIVADWWVVPLGVVDVATWVTISAAGVVMFLYVPATVMVLLRPNEGAVPAWLETRRART